MTANMHEAKTNLSRLIMLLEKGEDIILAKAGNPIAKLVSYTPLQKRIPNQLKGKVKFHDNFNSVDDEIIMLFEGGI